MKNLRWNDIFELEEGDPLSEEGYQVTVFKADTTVFEMISAWLNYTKPCHVEHVRVLLINEKVFPSDYILYDLSSDSFLIPKNPSLIPDDETWQGILGKRVAKHGCFFRIPQSRRFFDLYLRLEEDLPKKPMLVVRPKALLKEWQLDEAVKKINRQIEEGHCVLVPDYLQVISHNLDYSGIDVIQGPCEEV